MSTTAIVVVLAIAVAGAVAWHVTRDPNAGAREWAIGSAGAVTSPTAFHWENGAWVR